MSKEQNFHSLKAEFRDKGKAASGFAHVFELIQENKMEQLSYLLRYHNKIPVYGNELIQRFEFDTLLEFYNLLLIAALAGYIDTSLDKEMREEMKLMLSPKPVRLYYITFYPYKLTEYAYAYVRFEKYFEQRSDERSLGAFHNFISLTRSLKKDKEVERFQNMLDHVSYGDDGIDELNETFASYTKLNEAMLAQQKSPQQQAVWGFFKYSAFISQFKEILQSLNEFPLLQSAMWLYHGYYLERMNVEMKAFFTQAFSNIQLALSSPDMFRNIAQEIYGEQVPEDFDENLLIEYAHTMVATAREDVDFILDKKWAEPMKHYFMGFL